MTTYKMPLTNSNSTRELIKSWAPFYIPIMLIGILSNLALWYFSLWHPLLAVFSYLISIFTLTMIMKYLQIFYFKNLWVQEKYSKPYGTGDFTNYIRSIKEKFLLNFKDPNFSNHVWISAPFPELHTCSYRLRDPTTLFVYCYGLISKKESGVYRNNGALWNYVLDFKLKIIHSTKIKDMQPKIKLKFWCKDHCEQIDLKYLNHSSIFEMYLKDRFEIQALYETDHVELDIIFFEGRLQEIAYNYTLPPVWLEGLRNSVDQELGGGFWSSTKPIKNSDMVEFDKKLSEVKQAN